MDLRQYFRVLRAHWLLIGVSALICTVTAGYLAWTRAPIYAAHTQLFVSNRIPAGLSETYAGSLFSQQRVVSYAQIVSSPPVAEGVITQLDLPYSIQQLQAEIHASVPTDTVLINVTVKDRSPQRAKAIADALGERFPSFVDTLEKVKGEQKSPIKVTVTSPAELPTHPVSPRKALYLAVGVLLGLVLGIGGAVIREALDTRIKSADDAAAIIGEPVLGSIGERRRAKRKTLVMVDDPLSVRAEEYRRLRTNLHFRIAENRVRSFVVSSAVASEGKTLIAANLGIAFAQAGHRVVLVDADLRRPKLAEVMGLAPAGGLIEVLTGSWPVERAVKTWRVGLPLELLSAGPPPANPSELLGSQEFAVVLSDLADRADIVILDAPALLATTEAAILGRLTSGVILVTRVGFTRADQLESAIQSLRGVEARVLGIVVNRLRARSAWRRRRADYAPERAFATERRVATEFPLHERTDREA